MSSVELARVLRGQLSANPNFTQAFQFGIVVSFTTTAPLTVTVNLEGSTANSITVFRLSTYTPTIGDAVVLGRLIGKSRNALFVIGKLA